MVYVKSEASLLLVTGVSVRIIRRLVLGLGGLETKGFDGLGLFG